MATDKTGPALNRKQSILDRLEPGAGADALASLQQNAQNSMTGRSLKYQLIAMISTLLRQQNPEP